MTKSKKTATFVRNYRGQWFRNGRAVNTVPFRVLKLAANMSIECTITA